MFMWPGSQVEKEKEKKLKFDEKITECLREFEDHFGDNLEGGYWLDALLPLKLMYHFGVDVIIKYGTCSYCRHYIGFRKLNNLKCQNILILNSYCMEYAKTIKPDERCFLWHPTKFVFQLMQAEVIKKAYKKLNMTEKEYHIFVAKESGNYEDPECKEEGYY